MALKDRGRTDLRKDPVTLSWVIQEEEEAAAASPDTGACLLCPGAEAQCPRTIYEYPAGTPDWQVRVIPHFAPLYRIEGDAQRSAVGIYDKMRTIGAHEVVVEHRNHNLTLSQQSDENVAQVLRAFVSRLGDLKKDRRFKCITVFRNEGSLAGEEFKHPHSEITATPFIPRRVGYELRSAQRYFKVKDRCLFCDVLQQELAEKVRAVESDERFLAFCPFASRVPYETWLIPIDHQSAFEEHLTSWDDQLRLARLLKSVLSRLEKVAPAYHLVLHSSPNVRAKWERHDIWQTVGEDYHWHFEILPVIPSKSSSYSLKEVYYNSVRPETAAAALRKLAG